MPVPPRKRNLGAEQRLALQLLAGTPFGATEAAMFVNGFKRQTLVRLIHAGLATTQREIKATGQTIGRVRITEAWSTSARRLLREGCCARKRYRGAFPFQNHVLPSALACCVTPHPLLAPVPDSTLPFRRIKPA
jgi:hypothetical protein